MNFHRIHRMNDLNKKNPILNKQSILTICAAEVKGYMDTFLDVHS